MKLDSLPASFAPTRVALHQIAFFAMSPARYQSMGRMGLTATPGGYGTPEFDGRVLRVEGALLVDENDGNIATQTITTIRAASEFFGNEYETQWFADFHDPLSPADPDTTLEVDDASGRAIGEWFEFGVGVLNELRSHGQDGDDVSEVQLWPEHFDPATEMGDSDLGQRASFGASPGDGIHPEPYLYVAAWSDIDRSNEFWNEDSFNGASLTYRDLIAGADPHGRAMEFLVDGYRVLHTG